MEFVRSALAVAAKDLRIEMRAREIVYAMIFFSALVVLLFAFAFTREGIADGHAVARARDVLLGILLYPVVLPVLIAGTRGTQALLAYPSPEWPDVWLWTRIVLLFDVVFVTVALWVYEPLVAVE